MQAKTHEIKKTHAKFYNCQQWECSYIIKILIKSRKNRRKIAEINWSSSKVKSPIEGQVQGQGQVLSPIEVQGQGQNIIKQTKKKGQVQGHWGFSASHLYY